MRTCNLCLLALAAIPGLTTVALAHIGDEIYPFYELLDEDLSHIDLTDGSVEDWLEVVGEPSLTATEFVWGTQSEPAEYDPSSLDFRIWLAWHQGSGTIWIAMERVDDIYVNRFGGVDDLYVNLGDASDLGFWDSVVYLMVDGDHSGGRYRYVNWAWCRDCPREELLENQRQAQSWLAIGEAPDGQHLHFLGVANEWVAREPYAAAGGGSFGEGPAISVTRVLGDPLRRPRLRRRGDLRGVGTPPGQGHRIRDLDAGQRRSSASIRGRDPPVPDRGSIRPLRRLLRRRPAARRRRASIALRQ